MIFLFKEFSVISNENIEVFLRHYLKYFIFFVFITTACASYNEYLIHHSWTIGDWLINYQGGMVRRGFLGEIVYQLSGFTNLSPGFLVFLIQIILYATFFIFSYLLIKKQSYLVPYSLLIFSPFILTFQINAGHGGYRKEIFYFVILALVVYSSWACKHRFFQRIFYASLLCYPTLILTHEMLAVFLPYLIIAYISVTSPNKKNILTIFFLLIPSIISFFVCLYYTGTTSQVTEIFNSLTRQDYSISGGAIKFLSNPPAFYGVNRAIRTHDIINYLIVISLSIVAYIPIRNKLFLIFKNKISAFLFFITIVGTMLLFLVAIDWGRFIYIHLVSLFILSLMPVDDIIDNKQKINRKKPEINLFSLNSIKYLLFCFFIFYSMFWFIPHVGRFPLVKSYKEINAVKLLAPYEKQLLKNFK